MSPEQLRAVSRWESVNFYSLNVHGIRELLIELVARIHTVGFALPSEYFHHVIGEENEHMWFFATFCRRYGRIYPNRAMSLAGPQIPEADHFLVFARLLIFEEIVDVFNQRMGNDERLHPTIRQVNALHHQDESRHIAFGRQVVSLLHASCAAASRDPAGAARISQAVHARVGRRSGESVGVSGRRARRSVRVSPDVLADPARQAFKRQILHRTLSFLVREQIFADERIRPVMTTYQPGIAFIVDYLLSKRPDLDATSTRTSILSRIGCLTRSGSSTFSMCWRSRSAGRSRSTGQARGLPYHQPDQAEVLR